MSLGLLFPGQGTQGPEMLPWLSDEPPSPVLARMAHLLGTDWRSHLVDPAWSRRNDVGQPLLTGVCMAAWERLRPHLPAPTAVAGYSVGELAAFCAAGVFDAEIALRLATQRAAIMDRSVFGLDTGLLSITGGAPGQIEALCERHGLALAIRTGDGRALLGGLRSNLLAASAEADAAGAHGVLLPVSIASHTPWLADAVPAFAAVLEGVAFARPQAALVCNFDGDALRQPAALRQALAGQIAHAVPWDRCMDTLAERRVRCVLEVGPGRTLSALWNDRHPDIPARSIDEFQRPEAVVQWVGRALGGRIVG